MAIAINGSGTITGISAGGLPDDCITTSDIAANAVTYAKLGTTEQGQLCKAWVNFNGTTASPSTIRASYNVSSVTKNGTGDYTVNFTTAMVDTNYAFSFGAGSGNGRVVVLYNGTFNTTDSSSAKAVGSIRLAFLELSAGAVNDNAQIAVSVFR